MDHQKTKRMLTAAYQYSLIRLSLNLYTYYEVFCEDVTIPDTLKEYTIKFFELLKDVICDQANEKDILSLRNQTTEVMEVITAYTDCFQIYEYTLNRMERNFEEDSLVIVSDIQAVTDELIEYIVEAKEQSLMGLRVQSVLGQLPVRLTKQKFFEILSDSLRVYIGFEEQSFLDRLYFIRTESMLDLPLRMKKEYNEVYNSLLMFKKEDYKMVDKARYDQLINELEKCSTTLLHDSDLYLLLQELINDCYVIFLCTKEALIDIKEKEIVTKMISYMMEKFMKEDWSGIWQELDQYLPLLEGKQEAAFERYFRQSDVAINDISKDTELWKVERLLSDSPFIQLDHEDYQEHIASKEWVENKIKQLCEDLNELFKTLPKKVVRAVMAKLISGIPVPFKTIEELECYIKGSLETCTESGEREVSIQLLRELMVDDYEMV